MTKRQPTEADLLMWEQLGELTSNDTWSRKVEYCFCMGRKWRFDFALLSYYQVNKYAIEIEGGAWSRGRHTRGAGFIKDMEKYNHAALLGWRVLRFTPQQVLKGEAIAFVRAVLASG